MTKLLFKKLKRTIHSSLQQLYPCCESLSYSKYFNIKKYIFYYSITNFYELAVILEHLAIILSVIIYLSQKKPGKVTREDVLG